MDNNTNNISSNRRSNNFNRIGKKSNNINNSTSSLREEIKEIDENPEPENSNEKRDDSRSKVNRLSTNVRKMFFLSFMSKKNKQSEKEENPNVQNKTIDNNIKKYDISSSKPQK